MDEQNDIFMNETKDDIDMNKTNDVTTNNQESYKKKKIPSTVKRLVWNEHVGENIGKAKCMCCKTTDITQLSFHCGHVMSEKNGGLIEVNNLKPICQNCNSSMGTMNMDVFIEKYNLHNLNDNSKTHQNDDEIQQINKKKLKTKTDMKKPLTQQNILDFM